LPRWPLRPCLEHLTSFPSPTFLVSRHVAKCLVTRPLVELSVPIRPFPTCPGSTSLRPRSCCVSRANQPYTAFEIRSTQRLTESLRLTLAVR
jgi:hypothetical protein